MSPNFRHPVPLAKELVTLDDISGGRLTLGIGAGALEGWDTTMLGQAEWSPQERADRFAEFVDLTDRLLREPEVTFEGEFYTADEARTYPGCVQQPRIPFAIAAAGPRGMQLAARYAQTWVTIGDRVRQKFLQAEDGARSVREQMARLDDICTEVGRDPASLDRLVLTGPLLDSGLRSVDVFRETVAAYEEVGVTDLVVHSPRAQEPYAADLDTFEAIFASR
jgi:alkanesulfonate monooxygenase SsuD/methylene tetrahydromethanopterin reductase-like flavin-dependent oxidoreductase (luciferase family)